MVREECVSGVAETSADGLAVILQVAAINDSAKLRIG